MANLSGERRRSQPVPGMPELKWPKFDAPLSVASRELDEFGCTDGARASHALRELRAQAGWEGDC